MADDFRHALRIALGALLLSLFLFAALLFDAEAASAQTVKPAPIKASKVLATAKKHLGVPYVYGGSTAKGFDCSGYVSAVWEIGRRTTDTLGDVTVPIAKEQLMPGDALNYPRAGTIGHIRIFDKWATADRALVWVYEADTPQVMHRVVPYDPRYVPVRRVNIDSDVPLPPPPPLPKDWGTKPIAKPAPSAPRLPPATIAGRVIDEKTRLPIANARVFYWSGTERYTVDSVVTGNDGWFTIKDVPAGMYDLAGYAKNYDVEFRGNADLRTGGRAEFELVLAPAVGDLAGSRIGTVQPLPPNANLPSRTFPENAPTKLPQDHAIPNGWFYTQATGGDGITGFAIVDDGAGNFYSEFRRLGGVAALGYPISQRYRAHGFVVQAMQKGIMQWRPEVSQVWLTNVFDEMNAAGKDEWLKAFRSTPKPMSSAGDTGKTWMQIVTSRIGLLARQPSIRLRYDGVNDPLTFYGLPTSPVEDMGNHFAVRLQRAVIQLWKVDVPWAKAGETTVANGGDVAKEAGLVRADALVPIRSPSLRA